jgi:three-Cys-motif partner protein
MSRASDRHFDEFHGHTLLKHLVLRKYVGAWAAKLRSSDHAVWFIDGFAGEGQDKCGNPGSPLIAARLAEPFEADGQGAMRVIAFEKDPTRCNKLREVMRPYTDRKPPIVHVRCGILADSIAGVMQHIGDTPALFFLDPFGVDGILVDLLPKALQGPQNEVFALFADVAATRLHAVLVARGRDPDAEEEAVRAEPSLFPEFTEDEAARCRAEAEKSLRALRATQAPSERILADALGPGVVQELEGVPDEARRERLTRMFMHRLLESGAAYVLSLPVRDEANQRMYQLIYATKSAVGLRTMKEAMDSALRNAPLPEESVESMWAELRGNELTVVHQLAHHFAAREVRWTQGKDRGEADTVKRYLLEQTEIFPMQFDSVKARLEQDGYVSAKRPLTLRFPPAR